MTAPSAPPGQRNPGGWGCDGGVPRRGRTGALGVGVGGASSDRAWGLTSAGTRGRVGAPGLERDHADHAGKGGLGLLGASLTRLTRGSVTGVSCNLAESSLSDGVQPGGLSPARCALAEAGGAESLSSRWPCHENTQQRPQARRRGEGGQRLGTALCKGTVATGSMSFSSGRSRALHSVSRELREGRPTPGEIVSHTRRGARPLASSSSVSLAF